jgi:hypothetical protein
MNPPPRKMTSEDQAMVDAYLKKGGEIKKGKPGMVSENVITTGGFYGRRNKTTESTDDT